MHTAKAIYILSAQYGYCSNMQYAIWLLSSLHILQVGLDAINLLLGSLCNFMPYLFCMHKEVFGQFYHNNYIREEKKRQDNDPKLAKED